MNISKSLKIAIANKGATQQELSKYMGVDHNSVSRYANNTSSPTLKNLELMCEFFGVKVSEFIQLGEG